MHDYRIFFYLGLAAFIACTTAAAAAIESPNKQIGSNSSSILVMDLNDDIVNAALGEYPFFVLDCYASWCDPCMRMNAAIRNLSAELNGQVTFGMIDVEDNNLTAMNYNITDYPTLLLFRNGTLIDEQIGYGSESGLVQTLKTLRPDLDVSNIKLTAQPAEPPQKAVLPQVDIPSIEFGADEPALPMRINDSNIGLALSKYPFFVLMGFTDWCGYCEEMNGTIRDLSNGLKGQVAFGLINAEKNGLTANKYGISSYPRLLIFKKGALVRTQDGFRNSSVFLGMLKEIEPGLDLGQIKITPILPAPQAKPGITKDIEVTQSETDSTLKYLDRILNVTQEDRASGVTINVFIINACPQPPDR